MIDSYSKFKVYCDFLFWGSAMLRYFLERESAEIVRLFKGVRDTRK